jgi:Flp pilus assembly protein TadD
MSVVNRMLQDIDRRLGDDGVGALGAPAAIRSIPAPANRPRGARGGWIAAALLAIVAGAAMTSSRWHEWWDGAPRQTASASAAVASPPKAIPVAQATAAPPAPADEAATAPTVAATPAEAPGADARAAEQEAPSPALVAPPARVETAREGKSPPERASAAAAPSSPEALKLSLQLSAPAADAPRPRVAKTQAAPRSGIAVRQVAAEETVHAARALWSDGAQGAALATLREALAAAESSRDLAAAATLAREQARLEVAGNRPRAALDLLRRMEPSLAGDAEAWALRGNAEQRLALHADAAASYLAALRLRPAEGRWMLGAAISLAAGGELDAAQAWVERARASGAITPPIAAYLRELGIKAP